MHPRYEGELNRDLVGSAGGKLHEFADACRKFSAGSTVMDDVLITYWRELGAKVTTAAWPTEPISGSSNVPERLERLARLAVHCAELGSQLSTELVRVFFPLYLR